MYAMLKTALQLLLISLTQEAIWMLKFSPCGRLMVRARWPDGLCVNILAHLRFIQASAGHDKVLRVFVLKEHEEYFLRYRFQQQQAKGMMVLRSHLAFDVSALHFIFANPACCCS
jgi:hypothetical protein